MKTPKGNSERCRTSVVEDVTAFMSVCGGQFSCSMEVGVIMFTFKIVPHINWGRGTVLGEWERNGSLQKHELFKEKRWKGVEWGRLFRFVDGFGHICIRMNEVKKTCMVGCLVCAVYYLLLCSVHYLQMRLSKTKQLNLPCRLRKDWFSMMCTKLEINAAPQPRLNGMLV